MGRLDCPSLNSSLLFSTVLLKLLSSETSQGEHPWNSAPAATSSPASSRNPQPSPLSPPAPLRYSPSRLPHPPLLLPRKHRAAPEVRATSSMASATSPAPARMT